MDDIEKDEKIKEKISDKGSVSGASAISSKKFDDPKASSDANDLGNPILNKIKFDIMTARENLGNIGELA